MKKTFKLSVWTFNWQRITHTHWLKRNLVSCETQLRKSMNKSIHAVSVYGLHSHSSIAALTPHHMFWINCKRLTYISFLSIGEVRLHWTAARVQSALGSREWAENHYAILKFKFPMKLWAISSTVLQSETAAMLREWALNQAILK